jgi:MFS family permease
MMSALGWGAVIGGLLAARRASGAARRLAWTAGAWGAAVLAAALAPTLTVLLPCLALVGFGSISFNSLAKTTLQLAAVPAMRGTVMALWAMAWMGSTPLGGPLIGWVAGRLGSRAALIVGAAAAVAAGLAAYPGLRRADARAVEPARPNTVGE